MREHVLFVNPSQVDISALSRIVGSAEGYVIPCKGDLRAAFYYAPLYDASMEEETLP